MSLYDRARDLTMRQLQDKGFEVVLRRRTPGAYDPETGQSIDTQNFPALVLKTDERDQQGIPTNRSRWIMYITDTVPETTDHILYQGKEVDISEIRPLDPGGIVVFYRVFTDRIT